MLGLSSIVGLGTKLSMDPISSQKFGLELHAWRFSYSPRPEVLTSSKNSSRSEFLRCIITFFVVAFFKLVLAGLESIDNFVLNS